MTPVLFQHFPISIHLSSSLVLQNCYHWCSISLNQEVDFPWKVPRSRDLHVDPSDDDIFVDPRFKKTKQPSSLKTIGGLSSRSTTCEDLIKEFFEQELKNYFSNSADVALFMKMIAADGIETWW